MLFHHRLPSDIPFDKVNQWLQYSIFVPSNSNDTMWTDYKIYKDSLIGYRQEDTIHIGFVCQESSSVDGVCFTIRNAVSYKLEKVHKANLIPIPMLNECIVDAVPSVKRLADYELGHLYVKHEYNLDKMPVNELATISAILDTKNVPFTTFQISSTSNEPYTPHYLQLLDYDSNVGMYLDTETSFFVDQFVYFMVNTTLCSGIIQSGETVDSISWFQIKECYTNIMYAHQVCAELTLTRTAYLHHRNLFEDTYQTSFEAFYKTYEEVFDKTSPTRTMTQKSSAGHHTKYFICDSAKFYTVFQLDNPGIKCFFWQLRPKLNTTKPHEYRCSFPSCSYVHTSSDAVRLHENRKHVDPVQRTITMSTNRTTPICEEAECQNLRFRSAHALRLHQKNRHPYLLTFRCRTCTEGFSTASRLYAHTHRCRKKSRSCSSSR